LKIYFSIVNQFGDKKSFELKPMQIMIIGRSKNCHVQVNDEIASSQHLSLIFQDDCVFIEDLKSKNGILLNGIKVYKQRLYLEDKVKFGTSLLFFEHSKMDEEAIALLKSPTNNRLGGDLTLELETFNEKNKRIQKVAQSSGQKDFVKNSKLYTGADKSEESESGFNKTKLLLQEYTAILIDMSVSALFALLPISLMKYALTDSYEKLIASNNGTLSLTTGDGRYLGGVCLVVFFIVFKLIRSRKKGSLGERLLGLD
jgi:pSer/pThr/pTyr-binding forkhead associated (FHA) protein